MSTEEILKLVMKNMDDIKADLKEELQKLREDIESLIKDDPITRKECEQYREQYKGYPPWITVVFSALSGLIVFIITYFIK